MSVEKLGYEVGLKVIGEIEVLREKGYRKEEMKM